MENKKANNFSNKSFEENLIQLENIVSKMESSDISLDEAIKLYEEGLNLSIYLNNLLTKYEGKIKILEKNFEEGKILSENKEENVNEENEEDKEMTKESGLTQNSNKSKKHSKVKDSEEQGNIKEEKKDDDIFNEENHDDANQLFS